MFLARGAPFAQPQFGDLTFNQGVVGSSPTALTTYKSKTYGSCRAAKKHLKPVCGPSPGPRGGRLKLRQYVAVGQGDADKKDAPRRRRQRGVERRAGWGTTGAPQSHSGRQSKRERKVAGKRLSLSRPSPLRRGVDARRLSHNDEPSFLKVRDDPLSGDRRHDLAGAADALAAAEPQREGDCQLEVAAVSGRDAIVTDRELTTDE